MSDFLSNLAAKSLSLANAVQPRIPSLFEPQAAQANQPARLSSHLSVERAGSEEESSGLEISHPSTSALKPSTQLDPITSSVKPYAEATPKQADDGDAAAAPHRDEPARARGSTETLSDALKAPLDLSRPPALRADVALRPAIDPPTLLTSDTGLPPQRGDEGERRATLVPDIRRMVDEQINPLEAQRPPSVIRAEQVQARQPPAASYARTIRPAQVAPAPKLPVAHLLSPAAVAPASPEIKITIGRVDVRAVLPAPPVARAQPAARSAPTSLDDYLQERSGGRR